jgi:signal peptidase I
MILSPLSLQYNDSYMPTSTIITQDQNPFFEREKPKANPGAKVVNGLQIFVVFLFTLIFIYLFVATPNQVDGGSMHPTFFDREIVLTYRLVGVMGNSDFAKAIGVGYRRGDVIIFQKPGLNEFIKRIVGLPGDKVKVEGGKVYLNGVMLEEKYLESNVVTNAGDLFSEGRELTVPEGKVAAFGDNRPGSFDSRFASVGFIDYTWIKGRVLVRVWPPERFGITQHADYVYTP